MYRITFMVYSIYDDDENPFFDFETFEEAINFAKILLGSSHPVEILHKPISKL